MRNILEGRSRRKELEDITQELRLPRPQTTHGHGCGILYLQLSNVTNDRYIIHYIIWLCRREIIYSNI